MTFKSGKFSYSTESHVGSRKVFDLTSAKQQEDRMKDGKNYKLILLFAYLQQ